MSTKAAGDEIDSANAAKNNTKRTAGFWAVLFMGMQKMNAPSELPQINSIHLYIVCSDRNPVRGPGVNLELR
jgi:hypothetical protein